VTAFYYYELPFGKGKSFSTGNNVTDKWLIGGWNFAGIFNYYTGVPDCVGADGEYGSFFEEDCSVFSGGIPVSVAPSPLSGFPSFGRHNNVTGAVVTDSAGVSQSVATSGTINAFANPVAVWNAMEYPSLSVNSRIPHDQLYSFPYWNMDFSLGKKIPITERVGLVFGADAFNVFNHVVLNEPSLDFDNPAAFGVLSSQFAPGISPTGARILQLSARVEF
jgi:hypothetical protein